MTSSLKEALDAALKRAAEQRSNMPPPEIPQDWDDEGGAKEIAEVSTQQPKENSMTQTTTATNNPAAQKKPGGPRFFQTTNGVSRATFDFIKANPGLTRTEVIERLAAQGFSRSSTGSLTSQMTTQGMVYKDSGERLYAAQPEYTPVKSYAVRRAQQLSQTIKRKEVKLVVKPAKADEAPQTLAEKKAAIPRGDAQAVPGTTPMAQEWSVEAALKGLSVLQAKALYDELKKVFI